MTGVAENGLEGIIRAHPFFAGLEERFIALVCGCAKNVRFEGGVFLFHEGQSADEFYLLREGRVALEVAAPGRSPVTFQTSGVGEVVGISWLIAPYRWMYSARALERVRAIGIDGRCLREKCERDHELGYALLQRVIPILIQRLHATRLQILDVYGDAC